MENYRRAVLNMKFVMDMEFKHADYETVFRWWGIFNLAKLKLV